MSYFATYFGGAAGDSAAGFVHSYGAGNATILDDVFTVIQQEARRNPQFQVWETYSQANAEDGVVLDQLSARYIQQNEETIDLRITGIALTTRRAAALVNRSVEAMERHMLTQIVRRDGMDLTEAEDVDEEGRYLATQVVEVR